MNYGLDCGDGCRCSHRDQHTGACTGGLVDTSGSYVAYIRASVTGTGSVRCVHAAAAGHSLRCEGTQRSAFPMSQYV